jgi:hypothetical protein
MSRTHLPAQLPFARIRLRLDALFPQEIFVLLYSYFR